MDVATTIWRQIKASLTYSEIMSWGVSKKIATEYHGMPALQLRVSGLLHKGWVMVCLNKGYDWYEVYFLDVRGRTKAYDTEVYCDELGGLLDRRIERGDFTEAEYARKAAADSRRRFSR